MQVCHLQILSHKDHIIPLLDIVPVNYRKYICLLFIYYLFYRSVFILTMNNSQYHFMSINNVLAKPITQCQVIIRTKYKVKVIPDIVPVNSRKDICLLLAVSPPPLTKDSDDGPKVISHVIPSPGPGPTHLSSQGRWSPIFCSNSDRGVIIGPNTEAEACDGYDELTCRPLGTLLHIWAWNQSFGSCRQLWISGVEGSPCTSSSLQAQIWPLKKVMP